MKTYLLIFSLLCMVANCRSQTAQPNKIVYLKDGTNVKGTVIVNDSTGLISVIEPDHETHYYTKSLVAKIDELPARTRIYDLKARGYVCDLDLGGTGIFAKDAGNNLTMFSVNLTNSFLFSPYISFGGGLGYDMAGSTVYNIEMLSIYANTRVYFMKANVSPYMDFSFGYDGMFVKYTSFNGSPSYGYTVAKDHDPGMMFNPAMGMRFAVGKRVALTFGLGYKLFYIHNTGGFNDYAYDANFRTDGKGFYLLNSMTFRGGVLF